MPRTGGNKNTWRSNQPASSSFESKCMYDRRMGGAGERTYGTIVLLERKQDWTHCIRSALAPSSPLLLMMPMMERARLMPRGRLNACGSSSLECCIPAVPWPVRGAVPRHRTQVTGHRTQGIGHRTQDTASSTRGRRSKENRRASAKTHVGVVTSSALHQPYRFVAGP